MFDGREPGRLQLKTWHRCRRRRWRLPAGLVSSMPPVAWWRPATAGRVSEPESAAPSSVDSPPCIAQNNSSLLGMYGCTIWLSESSQISTIGQNPLLPDYISCRIGSAPISASSSVRQSADAACLLSDWCWANSPCWSQPIQDCINMICA